MDGPLDHSTGKGWVKDHAYGDGSTGDGQEECSGRMHAGWKWMGRSTTTQLRREVGQESHNAAGARGNFGWHCAAHQAVPPRVRQGSARAPTRTGRCTGRRRRAPPPSSSTTRSRSPWRRWRATPKTSTSRRARCAQLDQEQASGKRPLVLGPSGGCPRRLALRTGPSTLHVRIM